MSVEQLIQRLQALPPYYEVQAYCPGVEIRDFESDVVDVSLDETTKHALLEFTPLPGLQSGMAL